MSLRDSFPTALERDTLLVPEWIAESVVQETECFLKADLPGTFAARLAAKAYRFYPHHRHFKKMPLVAILTGKTRNISPCQIHGRAYPSGQSN